MKITNTDNARYYWSWKSILIDKQMTSCDNYYTNTNSAPKSAVTEFSIMETPDLELSDAQTGAKAVPYNVLQESKFPSYSKMRLKRRFSTTIPLPDTLFSLWVGTLSSVVRFSVSTCCKWHTHTAAHLKPYCKDRLLGVFFSFSLHTVGRDWGIVEVHLILNCYFILP